MGYISREALDKACEDFSYSKYDKSAFVFMRKLQDIPAADVVPVVRCKDCKHATMSANGWCVLCAKVNPKGTLNFPSGFFCAFGERP